MAEVENSNAILVLDDGDDDDTDDSECTRNEHLIMTSTNDQDANTMGVEVEVEVVQKPAAVVTPCKAFEEEDDDEEEDENKLAGNSRSGSEAGDTVSETSVASEALDIVFGKPATSAQDETTAAPKVENKKFQGEDDNEDSAKENKSSNKNKIDHENLKVEITTGSTNHETLPHCITPSNNNVTDNADNDAAVVVSPPRKTNRVSLTAAAFSKPSPFASPRSTTSATSLLPTTGLSELSKQLRVLQAKNQYLQSEMERCQRQLRIMSESKGVSVKQVLASLESACALEAYAELQSQITSLKAQLEALQMQKSPARSGGRAGGATPTTLSASEQTAALQTASLKQEIASLQLQLGEHEEIEAKLQAETKDLYSKVQTHQTAALTLEAKCAQQDSLLEAERNRTAELERRVALLEQEREELHEKHAQQQKQQKLAHERRLNNWMMWNQSTNENQESVELDQVNAMATTKKYNGDNVFQATAKPNDSTSSQSPARPLLQRTFSDPALYDHNDQAVKATVTRSFVPSILPQYSSTYKQWTYDGVNDAHRAQLYVKQSAKNMELELLCRHQQDEIEKLQQGQRKDDAEWKRLEMERHAAHTQRTAYQQQVQKLELDLRLEQEQVQSLQAQLEHRQEEFTLKKEQLQSRLQVHKERTVDLEGQLSSLYVAYELLLEDRSHEQTQQAELMTRLVDADSEIAKQLSSQRPPTQDDARLARQLSQQQQQQPLHLDASETGSDASVSSVSALSLRQRVGLLTPSPRRKSSVRGLFTRSSSGRGLVGLPPTPPLSATTTTTSSGAGLPPTTPHPRRRASTGSFAAAVTTTKGNPPPGTTICKGYLLYQQAKKKKLLGGEGPATWKRKYMVLKRGDVPSTVGSYSLWYGDVPQGKVRGTIPHLIRGISTVDFGVSTEERPHAFVVSINPRDPEAPVISLAAFSAVELTPWKQILQEALGVEYNDLTPEEQRRADLLVASAAANNYVA